jgi:hypothetical protein
MLGCQILHPSQHHPMPQLNILQALLEHFVTKIMNLFIKTNELEIAIKDSQANKK